MTYGNRARVGYTSPPTATEVFPYEFYRVAPAGVTLIVTTLAIVEMNRAEIDQSYDASVELARKLVRAGADIVVLGGKPINQSHGLEAAADLIDDAAALLGVPVTTSLDAQMAALRALGARRVASIHPFQDGPERDAMYRAELAHFGFDHVATLGAGKAAIEIGGLSTQTPLELARRVVREHPEVDTLHLSCPHWPVITVIDAIERELGVGVVAASQAIFWQAFRMCGIDDRIPGYGRLLREL
jgi:maleate cis-trans isomerase